MSAAVSWPQYFCGSHLLLLNDLKVLEKLIDVFESHMRMWPEDSVKRHLIIVQDQLNWARQQESFRGFPFIRTELMRRTFRALCLELELTCTYDGDKALQDVINVMK